MKDLENQKILLLMGKNNFSECMDCKFYHENIFLLLLIVLSIKKKIISKFIMAGLLIWIA